MSSCTPCPCVYIVGDQIMVLTITAFGDGLLELSPRTVCNLCAFFNVKPFTLSVLMDLDTPYLCPFLFVVADNAMREFEFLINTCVALPAITRMVASATMFWIIFASVVLGNKFFY